MTKTKEYTKKSLIVLMAMFFMGIGINLILYANIGADPFTTGVMGLFAAINRIGTYTFGTAQIIMNVTFIGIAFILNKKKIGFGTLISAFFIGVFIDFWKPILMSVLPAVPTFGLSLILVVVGILIVSTGIAVYVSPDFGLGAGEILPMIISEKTGWKFRTMKIAGDLLFFLIGISLGATYGVGTIIGLALMGPVIHFLLPYSKKLFRV